MIAEVTSPPGCVSPPDMPSCFRVNAAGKNGRERNDPPAEGGASGECGEVKLESEGENKPGEGSEARLWLART